MFSRPVVRKMSVGLSPFYGDVISQRVENNPQ